MNLSGPQIVAEFECPPQKLTLELNCHCNGINRWGLQEWLGHEGSTPYYNSTFPIKRCSQLDPLGLGAHLPFCLPPRDEDELPHLALDLPTSRTTAQTISLIYYLPICFEFCRAVESGPSWSASYKVGQGRGAHVSMSNTFSTVNDTAVSYTRWHRPNAQMPVAETFRVQVLFHATESQNALFLELRKIA